MLQDFKYDACKLNYSEFATFIDQLNNIADPETSVLLWLTKQYISIPGNEPKIKEIFSKWLAVNTENIMTKSHATFRIVITNAAVSAEEKLICQFIAQIGELWQKLPSHEQDTVWDWLQYFLKQINTA